MTTCCHFHPVLGLTAYFLAGLGGSLHCLGMCGPLSSLFMRGSSLKGLVTYHLSRLTVYSLAGLLVGLFADRLHHFLPPPFLLWPLVGFLLLYVFNVTLPLPLFAARLYRLATERVRLLAPWQRGLLLGVATPLLPCGLFYGALAGVLSAPDAVFAATWMAAFAAGTIPLLFVGQKSLGAIGQKLGVRASALFLKGCAVVTIIFLLWMSWKGGVFLKT